VPGGLSIVIVTTNEIAWIGRCVESVVAEMEPGDELIIADNGSTDGTLELVRSLAPEAKVVNNGGNLGFPGACNAGAAHATRELLVLLNPDTVVAPGFREAIRRPLTEGRGWDAWQALVTMDDGARVNTDGNVQHFTGIAWAGHMGQPITVAPREPRDVSFASGACMAMPLATWQRVGGSAAGFFMYCDDNDISLRLRLEGGRIGVEPAARVDHEYEFGRGRVPKWRMLERNRWAVVLRTYPLPLLLAVLPALVVTDIALLAIAARSGWGRQKLLAMVDVVRALPRTLAERREIQAKRRISSAEFARWLVPELSSDYLPQAARHPLLEALLRGYWRVARTAIGAG
jgi:GT2 family glycosyltransferase